LLDEQTLVRVVPFLDPVVRLELTGAALARVLERAARSAASRDCRTQVHVAGALVRFRCPCAGAACAQGFTPETDVRCASDADCAAIGGACGGFGDTTGLCFAPLALEGTYRVATTAYLAAGGSGLFEVSVAPARDFGDEPLHVAIAELLRSGSTCDGASERPDSALGCVEAIARRFGEACAASGLGDACSDIAADRERALAVCRHLTCLDGRLGAARDGRIRLEEP
jgi:hypothetical protein